MVSFPNQMFMWNQNFERKAILILVFLKISDKLKNAICFINYIVSDWKIWLYFVRTLRVKNDFLRNIIFSKYADEFIILFSISVTHEKMFGPKF